MDSIKLSKRLDAISGSVPKGAAAADVGTDHGHIPIFLALNGIASRIVASDLNQKPLKSASELAKKYGVADKIEFIRADGLNFNGFCGLDTVIISGMGGELIASIIDGAEWLRDEKTLLILQPQSKLDYLCSYLSESGYDIIDARLVRDRGKIYAVLTARSGPAGGTAGITSLLSVLYAKRDPLLSEYLNKLIAREAKTQNGRMLSKNHCDAPDPGFLETLTRMKEEIEKW